MSFASGLSSYVAQNIGARKLDRIGPGLKWGAVYSLGLSVVFMAIYLPFANKIISLFIPAGSASGVIDVARGYLFTVVPFYLSYAPSSCATACCAVPVQCVRSW